MQNVRIGVFQSLDMIKSKHLVIAWREAVDKERAIGSDVNRLWHPWSALGHDQGASCSRELPTTEVRDSAQRRIINALHNFKR